MLGQVVALATGMITLVVMWQAGNHRWWAWALGLANQGLWLLFIVVFAAWGLLPLTVVLTVTYARNLRKWRAELCRNCGRHHDEPSCVAGPTGWGHV